MTNYSFTSDMRLYDTLFHNGTYYSEDLLVEVNLFRNQITVTDIADAMKPGKVCREWVFSIEPWGNPLNRNPVDLVEMAVNFDVSTMGELIQWLREDRPFNDVLGLTVYRRERKSSRTFSPFWVPKSYKKPKKWNTSAVVKAIMAGAISRGEISQRLTDDYAFDAAYNFFEGVSFDLVEFAKELTEHPSGWHVYDVTDNTIKIACHLFDFRQLYIA